MSKNVGKRRIHPWWWTLAMMLVVSTIAAFTAASFTGVFDSVVPVTITADRSGLVLESGSKVKLRGVDVGSVGPVTAPSFGTGNGSTTARITLELDPADVHYIPANVEAKIRASTIFGAKFVELIAPEHPAAERISVGAVVPVSNVSTEVNTVFETLTQVLRRIDPPKLNAVLTTLADAVRGKGERIGQATTDTADVLATLNNRMGAVADDFRALGDVGQTYAAAAPELLATLSSASATSVTITAQAKDLDSALLATTGLANSGTELIGPSYDNLVRGINDLWPTTDLLATYTPEYTCTLQGAYWLIQKGAYDTAGGDGRSTMVDIGLGFASDPYRYPSNLPKVNARGGPDGKPGCGSLPRPDLKFPIRALVTDTGFGTGLDWRPNPGIAHPYGVNFFPVTKADPEPPRIYGANKPPAIGPVPYPGAPPYGAPLFGADGTPLWAPPPPGAPPPPVPGVPNPPPPYGTGPFPNSDQGGQP